MNRRSFLTLMASGVVGVSLIDCEWIPTSISGTLPETPLLRTVEEATAAMLRCVTRRLPDLRGTFVPGDYAISHNGLHSQFGIDMAAGDAHGMALQERQVIEPAADCLAREIEHAGLIRFGALVCPVVCDAVVATDVVTGVSIRGLRQYVFNPALETPPYWALRFDVLGAAQ